jgi:hypothetical protein
MIDERVAYFPLSSLPSQETPFGPTSQIALDILFFFFWRLRLNAAQTLFTEYLEGTYPTHHFDIVRHVFDLLVPLSCTPPITRSFRKWDYLGHFIFLLHQINHGQKIEHMLFITNILKNHGLNYSLISCMLLYILP